MAGIVTPIIDKAQRMIFGKPVIGAKTEGMCMIPSAPRLVILYQTGFILRLLPVARLFVGRVVTLVVRMRL